MLLAVSTATSVGLTEACSSTIITNHRRAIMLSLLRGDRQDEGVRIGRSTVEKLNRVETNVPQGH